MTWRLTAKASAMWIKLYIFITATTRCKTSLFHKTATPKHQRQLCLRLICDQIMHHVTIRWRPKTTKNLLVCGENVTYHVFSGKKTQSNQTGGHDWIMDETHVVLLECLCKIYVSKTQWHKAHTCYDKGDLAGQLGSLRVPSTKSISNSDARSDREADGKLRGKNENAQRRSGPPPGVSEEEGLPCTLSQPADTWQTGPPAPPRRWRRPGTLRSHTATTPDSASACWGRPVWGKDPTPAGTLWTSLQQGAECIQSPESFLIIGLLHDSLCPLQILYKSSPWICCTYRFISTKKNPNN